MTARYHVLCSDELMDSHPQWPSYLRPVEVSALSYEPGMRWWLFEDDEAPGEFDGQKVELLFAARIDGDSKTAFVMERHVLGSTVKP